MGSEEIYRCRTASIWAFGRLIWRKQNGTKTKLVDKRMIEEFVETETGREVKTGRK